MLVPHKVQSVSILDLPPECICHIASFLLSDRDILRLTETCTYLRDVCNGNNVWRTIYSEFFPARYNSLMRVQYWKLYFYSTFKLRLVRSFNYQGQGGNSVAFSRSWWYQRRSWCELTQDPLTTSKTGEVSKTYSNGWVQELDCVEKWNWRPEDDPDTEWVEE